MKGITKQLRVCCVILTISILYYNLQSNFQLIHTAGAPESDVTRCKSISPHLGHHSYSELEDIPSPSYDSNSTNRVIHKAGFGLGHRLCKMSSAWYLTKKLNLTRLELEWNDCSGEGNIFPRLFGSNHIDVPGSEQRAMLDSQNRNKSIVVSNDVHGHFGAVNFIKHQVPLSQKYLGEDSPFLAKMESDLQFYRILRQRFTGKEEIIRFMEEHKFRDHFVIGLHLRLGNEEGAHFVQLGRGVNNQTEFVSNLIELIESFTEKLGISHPDRFLGKGGEYCLSENKKSPLLFLATDSPQLIPFITNITFGLKSVVMPQIRVESGVTFYQLSSGEDCVKGWHDMLLDNILLSFSDVLIAARHSSFTQNLPMSLVFDRNNNTPGPHFCEVSDTAQSMTCVEDKRTWLFRDDAKKLFSYTIANETEVAVEHRKTVDLPGVKLTQEFKVALAYLKPSDNYIAPLRYGKRFNQQYRGDVACPNCTSFNFLL